MGIKATIMIDDDRWAKHPYGVKFDDKECNREFYTNGVDGRDQCYRVIERAKAAGYDIITPVLICNTADYAAVTAQADKEVNAGDDVLTVEEK